MNECARPLAPRVRLSLARDRIATERKRVARAPAVTWPAPARVVPPRASLCRDGTRARAASRRFRVSESAFLVIVDAPAKVS